MVTQRKRQLDELLAKLLGKPDLREKARYVTTSGATSIFSQDSDRAELAAKLVDITEPDAIAALALILDDAIHRARSRDRTTARETRDLLARLYREFARAKRTLGCREVATWLEIGAQLEDIDLMPEGPEGATLAEFLVELDRWQMIAGRVAATLNVEASSRRYSASRRLVFPLAQVYYAATGHAPGIGLVGQFQDLFALVHDAAFPDKECPSPERVREFLRDVRDSLEREMTRSNRTALDA